MFPESSPNSPVWLLCAQSHSSSPGEHIPLTSLSAYCLFHTSFSILSLDLGTNSLKCYIFIILFFLTLQEPTHTPPIKNTAAQGVFTFSNILC